MKKYNVIFISFLIFIMLCFVFYWFQWRPRKILMDCYIEAKEKSATLMEKKANLSTGQKLKEGADEGMYLKEDYEYLFKQCKAKYGLR